MKKSVFRRVFVLYAVVLVLAVFFIEIYLTAAVRKHYEADLGRDLLVRINLMSDSIPFDEADIDALCKSMKERMGNTRITVVMPDGKVIGDSDTESALMENHARRPEIRQALIAGSGSSVRFSHTLNYDFLYVAKKIVRNGTFAGFVRLAIPLKEIDEAVSRFRIKMILVVVMVLLATWLFSVWQTEHLRRLCGQLTDFSRSLARGEIDKRLHLEEAGEFDEIAGNLNTMSAHLQGTIADSEEEKKRLNVILESIPDALLIIDSKGSIQLSSTSTREFFGESALAGRQYLEVVRNREFSDAMDEVRRDLLPVTAEIRIDDPDERYFVVRISPLFYREGELSGFIAIFHDITEREKLEQVRKDFVANVSHEIKTPITAIQGFAETLLEGALDERENALKFLGTIKSNSERINSLVDDLMTISKIELGVIRVEKSEADVGEIIENVLTLLKDRASEKGLFLKTSVRDDVRRISADRNRLTQILTNLVDNAIKFTEKGGVTVGTDKGEGGRAFLFVEDTGIGVQRKHLARLGERFYRVDPARSRKLGGTGLGLAIVKHLVRAHGWDMQIESVQGKGTKVKIFVS
jgi:two-component system, OmpR family, phosphate regulon sensor histidine kinase PhoR